MQIIYLSFGRDFHISVEFFLRVDEEKLYLSLCVPLVLPHLNFERLNVIQLVSSLTADKTINDVLK